jgi:hypothetical protein
MALRLTFRLSTGIHLLDPTAAAEHADAQARAQAAARAGERGFYQCARLYLNALLTTTAATEYANAQARAQAAAQAGERCEQYRRASLLIA